MGQPNLRAPLTPVKYSNKISGIFICLFHSVNLFHIVIVFLTLKVSRHFCPGLNHTKWVWGELAKQKTTPRAQRQEPQHWSYTDFSLKPIVLKAEICKDLTRSVDLLWSSKIYWDLSGNLKLWHLISIFLPVPRASRDKVDLGSSIYCGLTSRSLGLYLWSWFIYKINKDSIQIDFLEGITPGLFLKRQKRKLPSALHGIINLNQRL